MGILNKQYLTIKTQIPCLIIWFLITKYDSVLGSG